MRNAGLEEAQAGIKFARRNINNLSTKGSLSFPSHLVRNRTLAPQLEKTNKTPLSWRDEDLLFLHPGGAWNATPRSLPSLERKIRSRTHA